MRAEFVDRENRYRLEIDREGPATFAAELAPKSLA